MQTKQLGNSDLNISPDRIRSLGDRRHRLRIRLGHPERPRLRSELSTGRWSWESTGSIPRRVTGLGHSEEVVAQALAGWSGVQPYVFTKCVLHWDEHGKIYKDMRPHSIRQECEDSLRRLKVEAIDLYQMHWPSDDAQETDATWQTLADLQKEGKVRWIGVSNFNVEQMRRAMAIAGITSLQPFYSPIRREVEAEVLPYCQREGIGVIVLFSNAFRLAERGNDARAGEEPASGRLAQP